MAMAYQNGTATDRYNLGDQIRIFLLANGWTINGFDGSEGGGLHVAKGGNYFNLYFSPQSANEDERLWIHLSLSTGYLAPNGAAQPGELFASVDHRCATNFGLSLYQEYYFFLDLATDTFYCVVEEELGFYRHFAFGNYNKIGQAATAQCGQFVWGTYTSYLSSAAGSFYNALPAWAYYSVSEGAQNSAKTGSISLDRGTGRDVIWNTDFGNGEDEFYTGDVMASEGGFNPWDSGGFQRKPFACANNSFNNRIITLPVNLWAGRASNLRTLVGQFPSFRLVNLEHVAPEQIIDGDWMCFPLMRKGSTGDYHTDNVGLAYKKV